MKLTNYVVLVESLKTAKNKYLNTGEINNEDFNKLIEGDPSKTKKYLEWMCKIYASGDFPIDSIIDIVKLFDKAIKTKFELPSKDINYYKNSKDFVSLSGLLNNEFRDYQLHNRATLKQQGAEKIFENDKCIILYIKTKKACMLYGSHTKWCITEKDRDFWEDYQKTNIFFFILDKRKPNLKYALAIDYDYALYMISKTDLRPSNSVINSKIQTFNSRDKKIDTNTTLKRYSISFSTFKTLLTSTLDFNEKNYLEHLLSNNTLVPVKLNGEIYYDILSPIRNLALLVENKKFKIKFNKCNTDFDCASIQLDSLEGAPKEVNGTFSCYNCGLKSLKGAPEKVSKIFVCSDNPITSLEGGPKKVGKGYFCINTNITNLIGSPKEWGSFDKEFDITVQHCDKLVSLKGSPEKAFGECIFAGNKNLTTLEGGPKEVYGIYSINGCTNLTSLKGAPKYLGSSSYFWGEFNCSKTSITSLVGLPDTSDCNYNLAIEELNLKSLKGLPTKATGPLNSGYDKMTLYSWQTFVNNERLENVIEKDPNLKGLYLFD